MRATGRLLLELGLAIGIEATVLAEEGKTQNYSQVESQLDEKTKEEIKKLNKEARKYHDEKDYSNAERLYKKSLEISKVNPRAYGGLGTIYYELGDLAKSEGNSGEALKKYDIAEDYYKKGLELDPNSFITNLAYGAFLCDIRQDYKNAKVHLDKALDKKPDDPVAKAWREVVKEKIGE